MLLYDGVLASPWSSTTAGLETTRGGLPVAAAAPVEGAALSAAAHVQEPAQEPVQGDTPRVAADLGAADLGRYAADLAELRLGEVSLDLRLNLGAADLGRLDLRLGEGGVGATLEGRTSPILLSAGARLNRGPSPTLDALLGQDGVGAALLDAATSQLDAGTNQRLDRALSPTLDLRLGEGGIGEGRTSPILLDAGARLDRTERALSPTLGNVINQLRQEPPLPMSPTLGACSPPGARHALAKAKREDRQPQPRAAPCRKPCRAAAAGKAEGKAEGKAASPPMLVESTSS